MQNNAIGELYRLERSVRASGNVSILESWRRLQAADNLFAMSTRYFDIAPLGFSGSAYDAPVVGPYDYYINFMNIVDDIRNFTY